MSERFLNPVQVAYRLAIAVSTARQWMRDGILPAVKLPSNEWRMAESELIRWMTERKKP